MSLCSLWYFFRHIPYYVHVMTASVSMFLYDLSFPLLHKLVPLFATSICLSWHLLLLLPSAVASLVIYCFSAICSCLSWHLILRLLVSSIAPLAILYCLALHLLLLLLASSIDTSHKYMGAVSPLLPNAGRRSFSILTIYFFLFLFHFRCLLCLPIFIFIFFCLHNAFCLIFLA